MVTFCFVSKMGSFVFVLKNNALHIQPIPSIDVFPLQPLLPHCSSLKGRTGMSIFEKREYFPRSAPIGMQSIHIFGYGVGVPRLSNVYPSSFSHRQYLRDLVIRLPIIKNTYILANTCCSWTTAVLLFYWRSCNCCWDWLSSVLISHLSFTCSHTYSSSLFDF